jgi:hypothetical protein
MGIQWMVALVDVAVVKLHSMSIISSGHLVHPTLDKSFTEGVVHANSDMHVGATLFMSFSNFNTPSWCLRKVFQVCWPCLYRGKDVVSV